MMDRFVRVKEIGEGSFGKALLVRSKANGKQMVIKEINMKKMGRKEREDARKEVAVLAQLHHPNIVCYQESFEEIGNLYIAMDYCDGGDLYGRINKQRGILFPEDQVLDWFVQTCLAIKHIHDRKILHRDIKSQNIFLTRHGIVKLGDFGIAKVLNSTVELARTCIGTPYYLSPEICENKPYNNKSDVWSLGCVLYELSTLKHAFEAGNMKNLVLKIIRGSYPSPPSRYSYDLRSLISILFKRNPRDRPSINSVLRKPLLQTRIRKFLSENEVQDEFSHTVMHGVKIKKQVPSGARPLPPKPQIVVKAPAPSPGNAPKYNPASVYAPSVARRPASGNRKSAEVRKSGGNVRPSPSPAPANNAQDLARRRNELLEKERKRREEAKKKDQQQQQYAKKHQEIVDKQRAARMNKAREEGWKGMLDSLSSGDSEKSLPVNKKEEPAQRAPSKPSAAKERGNYDNYHNYLDKLKLDRDAKKPIPQANLGVAGALGGAAAIAARQGAAAGARGANAANQARIYSEFVNRKQEAAINKARAHGEIYGGAAAAVSPRVPSPRVKTPTPTPSAGQPASNRNSRESASRSPSGSHDHERDRNEQDYLARLKQIRLQNLNERRNIKDRVSPKADPKYKPPIDPKNDPDIRRKKIEALKAQADERAQRLRDELQKKRQQAYELEQKKLREQGKGKGQERVSKVAGPVPKPAPPVPMTEAMKAIGVVREDPKIPSAKMEKCPIGMTAAMEAIGAGPPQVAESPPGVSERQKQKEAILKRLNAKPMVAGKPDRAKWGAVEDVSASKSDRPKWGAGDEVSALRAKSLEETGSHMESTNAADAVMKHLDSKKDTESSSATDQAPASSRKQWGGAAGTVLNVLGHANISDGSTATSEASASDSLPRQISESEEVSPKDSSSSGSKAPAIGTTITIAKQPGVGGTIVIKKVEPSKEELPSAPKLDTQIKRSRSPSPNIVTTQPDKPKPSSPVTKQEGQVSALFDRVELVEDEESRSNVDMSLVVEDLTGEEEEAGSEGTDRGTVGDRQKLEEVHSKASEQESIITQEGASSSSDEQAPSKESVLSSSLKDPALILGLTTGHFDTDVLMLRTCSEPDLSKLFRTILAENPTCAAEILNHSHSVEPLEEDGSEVASQDDDELEDTTPGIDPYIPEFDAIDDDDEEKEGEETKEEEAQEEDEEDEDEEEDVGQGDTDEEDLHTMRQSMMSLLQTEDATEDEPLSTTPKKKSKKVTKKGKRTKKKKAKDGEPSTPRSGRWTSQSMSDLQSMKETMKTLLKPEPATAVKQSTLKPINEASGAGDADTKPKTQEISTIQLECETWQSDEEDDDYFEEEDMFSRLEASRAKLEQELGCDTFLKAYKTVQAIHEDEDENMEEGVHLVSGILGHDNIHLYPTILQLVMADGVFTEDND